MMEKKLIVCGVLNMAGIAKKSGNRYSMFKLFALEPIAIQGNVANACGYEPREYECEEQVLNQLQRCEFPVDVTAFLDLRRDNKVSINSVRILPAADSKLDPAVKAVVGSGVK